MFVHRDPVLCVETLRRSTDSKTDSVVEGLSVKRRVSNCLRNIKNTETRSGVVETAANVQ